MANYKKEDLLAQAMIAFGQGARDMRVSHDACRAIEKYYLPLVDEHNLLETWATDAVQILERVRAVGRLAGQLCASQGGTAIGEKEVVEAMRSVHAASDTGLCQPGYP